MSTAYDIILEPILTEKTDRLHYEENTLTFKVKYDSTKPQIREAVEELFDVEVDNVNTLIMPTKPRRIGMYLGRTQAYKKAYVTLPDDEYLDLYALDQAGEQAGTV